MSNPIPEIFVLWHPSCVLGEVLARRIYGWLRPGNGLGPQVYYRSLPAPNSPPNGLPSPLPGEPRAGAQGEESMRVRLTNLQIVLPLIDDHMVVDPAWREWLRQLKTQNTSKRRVIQPIALDATAYNMPAELRELNYLRPTGLPLANAEVAIAAYEKVRLEQSPTSDERALAEKVEGIVISLLKQLTETLTRLLLPRSRTDGSNVTTGTGDLAPPKVTIFLSHAKEDGRVPAQRLRDYIYSQTQMAAFYDENDIAVGSVFAKVIDDSLDSPSTAAMIAMRSATYARRPWCRREVSLFRQPKRVDTVAAQPAGYERWRLYPLIVVEAMEGAQTSFGIPEFGNAPLIRWSGDAPNIEERIVTAVIRDALLAAYHSALAASIDPVPNRIVLNWLPDPTTLLLVKSIWSGQELDIIHPGQGLSGTELNVLDEFFPKLTFHSFEEILS